MAFGAGRGDKGSRSHAKPGERVIVGGWKDRIREPHERDAGRIRIGAVPNGKFQ
jgi:hypothetical protein